MNILFRIYEWFRRLIRLRQTPLYTIPQLAEIYYRRRGPATVRVGTLAGVWVCCEACKQNEFVVPDIPSAAIDPAIDRATQKHEFCKLY